MVRGGFREFDSLGNYKDKLKAKDMLVFHRVSSIKISAQTRHRATWLCTFAPQMSERLAAAVLMRETPLPGAAGQRQQQEEDPAHNKNRSGAADARHGPGEVVGKRHRVLTGEQGQHGLVEDQQRQKHQEPWSGKSRDEHHLRHEQVQAGRAPTDLTG